MTNTRIEPLDPVAPFARAIGALMGIWTGHAVAGFFGWSQLPLWLIVAAPTLTLAASWSWREHKLQRSIA